jgi:hypothetical protein
MAKREFMLRDKKYNNITNMIIETRNPSNTVDRCDNLGDIVAGEKIKINGKKLYINGVKINNAASLLIDVDPVVYDIIVKALDEHDNVLAVLQDSKIHNEPIRVFYYWDEMYVIYCD